MAIKSRRISSTFLIGIFVFVGVFAIIGILIWLGATQFLQQKTFYTTYFVGSVEGLDKGSPVKYLGVSVGSVSSISVAPDGRLIEVVMQITKKISLNDSLRVKSELSGLTGAKFLQLHFPTDPRIAAMNPPISFKPPYPIIKSAPSGIDEIEIAMRDVINNLRMIDMSKISSETVKFLDASINFFENRDLMATITNLKESSAKLESFIERADTSKILDYIANTSSKLYQTSSELKLFTEKLNEEIDNLHLDKYIQNAFARYDTTMASTKRIVEMLGYRTENTIFGLDEVIQEIKETNKRLQKSMRALSDHPTQVFFSEPPPRKD
jgi:phospholipid/cholesterol/gamma-HCH transport system substrate-binding protein